MKKNMKRIKDLANDNTRLTVLFLVIALFIVIFIVYSIAGSYFNYSTTSTENYYVYLGGEKVEFAAEVTQNRKGLINTFKSNRDINFESLPIYGKNEIVFPSDMLISLYDGGNYKFYRTHAYSRIKDDAIITNDYTSKDAHYFIYDANNLYVFNDAGVLSIDNKEIQLSSYSYVICTDDTVSYYNYAQDEYVSTEYKNDVIYDSHYYYLNLSEDTISRTGDLLPKSLNYLKFIKK